MRRISLAIALGVTFLAIKNTTASKKAISLERRYGNNFVDVWTAIQAINTNLTAFESSISGIPSRAAFLANLSIMNHQSDNNTTLAGVLAWSNNLTDQLVANGYMQP